MPCGCRCPTSAQWRAVCSACCLPRRPGCTGGRRGSGDRRRGGGAGDRGCHRVAGQPARSAPAGGRRVGADGWRGAARRSTSAYTRRVRRRRRGVVSSARACSGRVSANAGLVAAAAGALLVTAPPIEPTVSSVARADRSRRPRRPGAGGAGRAVAATPMAGAARRAGSGLRFAGTRCSHAWPRIRTAQVDPEPLIWLRDAFTLTERQARRRPLAYRSWYGLPRADLGHADRALAGRSTSGDGGRAAGRAAACWTSSRSARQRRTTRRAGSAGATRRRRGRRGRTCGTGKAPSGAARDAARCGSASSCPTR